MIARYLAALYCIMLFGATCLFATAADYDPDDKYAIEIPPDNEQDLRISHLPLTFTGNPGLLYTASTRTVKYLHGAAGIAGVYHFSSGVPEYRQTAGALNLVFGFPKQCDISVHLPYLHQDFKERLSIRAPGITIPKGVEQGLGDLIAWFRWGILHKINFLPALALGAGYMAPTGDYRNLLGSVKNYGLRFSVAASLEMNHFKFTDYALGLFFEGQLVLRDLFYRDYEEKSGLINIGILLPVDRRNFFNFLVEYNGVFQQGWLNDLDNHAPLVGLRFVHKYFGLTAGYSYVFWTSSDWDDSQKVIATIGGRF